MDSARNEWVSLRRVVFELTAARFQPLLSAAKVPDAVCSVRFEGVQQLEEQLTYSPSGRCRYLCGSSSCLLTSLAEEKEHRGKRQRGIDSCGSLARDIPYVCEVTSSTHVERW